MRTIITVTLLLLPSFVSAALGQTQIGLYKQKLAAIDKQLAEVKRSIRSLNNPAKVELHFLHQARETSAGRLRVAQAAGVVFGMPNKWLAGVLAADLDEMDAWLNSEQARQEELKQAHRQAEHLRALRSELLSLIAKKAGPP